MKKILLILAVLISAVSVYAQTPAPITGSSFVCLGSTTVLSDLTPGGTWSSSNVTLASVGPLSGVVTGNSLGSVVITYSVGSSFVTTLITIKGLPVINPASYSGCVNTLKQFTGIPSGGSWGSSNSLIATANFLGVVSGISAGVVNISYTEAGGCTAIAPVTINPVPTPITGTTYAYTGTTTTLSDATPGGNWSSSNPALATVGATTGIVTGAGAGLLLISYTLPTGCSAFSRVEIDPLPARANLVAWYPFCGDTTDHSGNGRDLIDHGIITAPATLTADRFGNANSAYQFNGVNSMMNYTVFFPNSGTPPDFTYSCWVFVPANQSAIILYNGNPQADGFGFVINNGTLGTPGNQVGVLFGGSGLLYASQTITLGAWHNLVLVKNGGVYHFYIDNGSGLFFIETTAPVFSDVFALGLNYHSTLPGFGPLTDAFDGSIDDVAVINRQLTNAERLSLFNFNPDAKKFSLGNDTTICTDIINLAPDPQTLGGLYTWSNFVGLSFVTIDTTDTLVTVYPVAGPFGNTYALTISKPYGCSFSDTITIYKSPIPVNLGPDQNVCIGDTIQLSQFFPSASFLWSTGDTAHSIGVTTTGTYYVTVDSIYNGSTCVGRDTIDINFHAVPIIGLPATVRNCNGAPFTLVPHQDPGYTFFWSTGVTTDSLPVATSGTYWVRVSDSGCLRYDTSIVLIVFDTVSFFAQDTAVCRGGHKQVTGLDVTLNPICTYQWTPTAGISNPNIAYPDIIADTSAEYIVRVSYPGCPDFFDSFHIDVQPNPQVRFTGNRDVCDGDTVHLSATVTPDWYSGYIYNWAPSIGLDYSTRGTVVFTAGDTTKYILTVTTPAWRTGGLIGCIGVDSMIVYSHPRKFNRLDSIEQVCPGDSIQLIPVDTSTQGAVGVAYHWTPSIYLDDANSATPWVRAITNETYTLVAYSQFGCKDTLHVDFKVHPAAMIEVGDSVILYPGESVHLQPQTNCSYFTWFPNLGLNTVSVSDPIANPDVSTKYYVHAMTEMGCVTDDSISIHVDPNSLIAIPNAFSPGSGYNNKFSVIKRGIVSLNYFRIFDRWGVKVFETTNIDEGWDGNYKAKPQPFGVYVYEFEAKTDKGKVFTRHGNVTLIR